jgi:hypothetical protein
MRRLLPPVVLLACVALGWQIGGAARFGADSKEAREAVRLRAHFAQVERELLARDISSLSPRQRAARAEQIRRLRMYAEAGEFPRNDYHPGVRVPYFRDARGNLCAMAYLIAASGRGDIVDHIARTRNYAYIPDLVNEPGLSGWLEDNGLTVAEAARIQPEYDGGGVETSGKHLMFTGITTGLSGLSILLNARSPERLHRYPAHGVLGIGAGILSLGLGVIPFAVGGDISSGDRLLGAWNVAVGVTALSLGVRALVLRPDPHAAEPQRLTIIPTALAHARPAIGFQGILRF